MAETMKPFDGYKTYAACIFTVLLSAVGFYYERVSLEVLIYTVLGALIFISNRMGNKADVKKVIEATTVQTETLIASNKEHIEKALAATPVCKEEDSFDKSVSEIIKAPN